jgi:signal transduction histidine kinase/anti-sigma regulatory factor (Ser/Thr protein kinase)
MSNPQDKHGKQTGLPADENELRAQSLAFKPRARMLVLLGDQLIRDAGIAVFELVKNAYDADATKVDVTLKNVSDRTNGLVVIEDDGCGMGWNDIVNIWLEPGTDHRHQQKTKGIRTTKFNRLPLGEKGVGRFAAHKLGKIIRLISRKVDSPEVVVEIDWNDFTTERYLSDAQVKVSERRPQHFTENRTGTRIEVSDLNAELTRGMVRQIHRAVNSVSSPFSEPNEFKAKVVIEPADNTLAGLLTIGKVLDLAPYRATCWVENNTLTYDYEFVPPPGLERINGRKVSDRKTFIPDLDDIAKQEFSKKIGRLLIEFRIYDLDAQTLEYSVSDKKGFKDVLRNNGGIRVYRDGVRVYDYGELGDDWLDLGGSRVNQPGVRVSNNQIVGAVHLEGVTSVGLVEKTNREGFIEDSTFDLFKKVVEFALRQIVFERNTDKERLRTLYSKKSLKEPVLNELVELRLQLERHPQVSAELLPFVDAVESQYREMRDRLLTAAGTGLTLSVVIHEVEKAIKSLSVAVDRNTPLTELKNLATHLNELIEGLTYLTRKSGRRNETFSNLIRQTLFNTNYRTKAHGITVDNGIERGNPDLAVRCTRRLIIATLMNLIDNSIYWLSTKGSTEKLIYIGSSTDLPGGPVLFIADNGPGFQDPPELLVQPFMSRRPEGMGLGLHIASEVMKAHEGRLIFPTADDIGMEEGYSGAIVGLQFKDKND